MGRSYEHAEFNEAFALAHETFREEDHVFTFARASGEHEWSLVAHVDGAVELCASVIVGGMHTCGVWGGDCESRCGEFLCQFVWKL